LHQVPEIDEAWLKEAHEVLPKKYSRNLQRAFVLHPNFYFKAWWLKSKGSVGDGVAKKALRVRVRVRVRVRETALRRRH